MGSAAEYAANEALSNIELEDTQVREQAKEKYLELKGDPNDQDCERCQDIAMRFATNLSPTLRAQLLGYDEKLAYFKTLPNDEWPKYNNVAGQEFWIPLQVIVCEQPMEWSCQLENN